MPPGMAERSSQLRVRVAQLVHRFLGFDGLFGRCDRFVRMLFVALNALCVGWKSITTRRYHRTGRFCLRHNAESSYKSQLGMRCAEFCGEMVFG
jgi:hypothetical protein